MLMMMCVCSKARRGSSGVYDKDEKLTEKEKELMEKDAEVNKLLLSVSVCLSVCLSHSLSLPFCLSICSVT